MLWNRKQGSLFLAVTDRLGPGSGQSGCTGHVVKLEVRGGSQIPAARAPRATASSLKVERRWESCASSGRPQGGVTRLQRRPHSLEVVSKGPGVRTAGQEVSPQSCGRCVPPSSRWAGCSGHAHSQDAKPCLPRSEEGAAPHPGSPGRPGRAL